MLIERRNLKNYKEISLVTMLIPMLVILIDTLGRMNSKIDDKNLFEIIFNEVFLHREIIVKFIIAIVIIFIISRIKVIKEKFILGDFKMIIGYTTLGIISYKFFGNSYDLSKSLDMYVMCIISMIFILSGIRDALSSIDNIQISIEERSNFERLIYVRAKYLLILYFIIFTILIAIENLNSIVSSDFIVSLISNYNNMARVISLLGVVLIIAIIIIIRKSFSNLNLCYEEYIYIIKHKTVTEEIKKNIDFVNLKVEANKKYINNKFKKLEDKKVQILLKGIFDFFKNNKR